MKLGSIMNNHIYTTYETLIDNQNRQSELVVQIETLLNSSLTTQLKFYLQTKEKRKQQTKLRKRVLDEYKKELEMCEKEYTNMSIWLKNKSAISKKMLLDLLQFLLSEYEKAEVWVREGNVANDLTNKEILSILRSNMDIQKVCHNYYEFYGDGFDTIYRLPIFEQCAPLFYVLDLETGDVSETFTMQRPKLGTGILEFLNYRIEHPEIDAEDILIAFKEYYKNELNKTRKVKS